jgi:hypothetical protein
MFKATGSGTYGCDGETCTLFGGGTVSARLLASIVVYLDLAYSALFLIALPLLRSRLAAHAGAAKASVAEFSVVVWGLPRDARPEEIHAHFDWVDGPGGTRPAGAEGGVQGVYLAHNDGSRLARLQEMARVQDQRDELMADLQRRRMGWGGQTNQGRVAALEAQVKECEQRVSGGRGPQLRWTVCAFVVFQTRKARDDCLRRFTGRESTEYSLRCWGQRLELRLRKHCLKVKPAAEPADVLWENLEYGWTRRAWRRLLSWLVSLVLVVLALLAVVADKSFSLSLRASRSECTSAGFAPACNAALRWDAVVTVAGCAAPASQAGCTLADLWGAGLVGGVGSTPAKFPGDPLLVPLDVNVSASSSAATVLLLGADSCRLANRSTPLLNGTSGAAVSWLPASEITRACAFKARATSAQWAGLVLAGWRSGVPANQASTCTWCFCEVRGIKMTRRHENLGAGFKF